MNQKKTDESTPKQDSQSMIVHFIATRGHILKEIDVYRTITKTIKDAGHTVPYDWIEEVYQLVTEDPTAFKRKDQRWIDVDKINEEALVKADVVIVEASLEGFFTGYQTARAVQLKKPILILAREDSSVAASGISTPIGFIKSALYEKQDLRSLVTEFLNENALGSKDLRFNFFLDRQAYNYLRWASAKTGKTKAQILRSLLEKEMTSDQ